MRFPRIGRLVKLIIQHCLNRKPNSRILKRNTTFARNVISPMPAWSFKFRFNVQSLYKKLVFLWIMFIRPHIFIILQFYKRFNCTETAEHFMRIKESFLYMLQLIFPNLLILCDIVHWQTRRDDRYHLCVIINKSTKSSLN